MEEENYHINFQRTGGFSGASRGVEIDSRKLPSEEAEALKLLIDASGFFETFTSFNTLLNMPDQFRYKITIEGKGKSRTLELSDASLPNHFRPLINYLMRLARSRKKQQ